MSCEKSCFNCNFLNTWNDREVNDSGWDCKHPDNPTFPQVDPLEVDYTEPSSDDQQAQLQAADCPGYEFKDWEKQHRQEAESEADYYENMQEPSAEDLERWREQQRQANEERLISLGLLTPDGQPTDEYYRQSDQAYDAARESRR